MFVEWEDIKQIVIKSPHLTRRKGDLTEVYNIYTMFDSVDDKIIFHSTGMSSTRDHYIIIKDCSFKTDREEISCSWWWIFWILYLGGSLTACIQDRNREIFGFRVSARKKNQGKRWTMLLIDWYLIVTCTWCSEILCLHTVQVCKSHHVKGTLCLSLLLLHVQGYSVKFLFVGPNCLLSMLFN